MKKKNSPNKQSSSFLLNILNSEENTNKNNKNILNDKQKAKEIIKININLDKCKNKTPQRQYYDKYNKDNKDNKDIDKNDQKINNKEISNKDMDNNLNKNCNIIPFKKCKNNKFNINYKKINSKNIKYNKTPKTNNNYSEKNEEIGNISEIHFNNNSQIINNLLKKEINNYSFNKQDYKNHKKSYIKI